MRQVTVLLVAAARQIQVRSGASENLIPWGVRMVRIFVKQCPNDDDMMQYGMAYLPT